MKQKSETAKAKPTYREFIKKKKARWEITKKRRFGEIDPEEQGSHSEEPTQAGYGSDIESSEEPSIPEEDNPGELKRVMKGESANAQASGSNGPKGPQRRKTYDIGMIGLEPWQENHEGRVGPQECM